MSDLSEAELAYKEKLLSRYIRTPPLPKRKVPKLARYKRSDLAKLLGVSAETISMWRKVYGYPNAEVVNFRYWNIPDKEIERGQMIIELHTLGFEYKELFPKTYDEIAILRSHVYKNEFRSESGGTLADEKLDAYELTGIIQAIVNYSGSDPARFREKVLEASKKTIERFAVRGRVR